MKIKSIRVNCTALEDEEDGTFGLGLTITGLTREHMAAIAEQLKEPVKAVLAAVVGEGGKIPVEHIDARGPVQ